MDINCVIGEKVRFEAKGDASGGLLVTVYNNDGGTRPIGATERLVVYSVDFAVDATLAILYGGTGASPQAGEYLALFSGSTIKTDGTIFCPMYCRRGVTPKVWGSTTNAVALVGTGVISKS